MKEQHNLADDLRALLREIRILFPDDDAQLEENQPFTNIAER